MWCLVLSIVWLVVVPYGVPPVSIIVFHHWLVAVRFCHGILCVPAVCNVCFSSRLLFAKGFHDASLDEGDRVFDMGWFNSIPIFSHFGFSSMCVNVVSPNSCRKCLEVQSGGALPDGQPVDPPLSTLWWKGRTKVSSWHKIVSFSSVNTFMFGRYKNWIEKHVCKYSSSTHLAMIQSQGGLIRDFSSTVKSIAIHGTTPPQFDQPQPKLNGGLSACRSLLSEVAPPPFYTLWNAPPAAVMENFKNGM